LCERKLREFVIVRIVRARRLCSDGGAPRAVGGRPLCRLRDAAPDPERRERRQNAEQKHHAPRRRAQTADVEPDRRGDEEAEAESTLHQTGAFAARVVGPHLRHHRGTGAPFGTQRQTDAKTQHRKRNPRPREGRQAGECGIRDDRADHHAFAPEIIGKHAAQDTAARPAQQRDPDRRTGKERNLRVLRRVQKLVQRDPDRQDQGVGFVAVEEPAEVGRSERFPLLCVERPVPRHRCSDGHRYAFVVARSRAAARTAVMISG
jgi:hypothetical protein